MCNAEINKGIKVLSTVEQVKMYELGLLAMSPVIRTELEAGYQGPGADQIMDSDDQALAEAQERLAPLYKALTAPAGTRPERVAIDAMCARARAMV